jgi:branched-chain amino acid transport system permease protein
MIGALTGRRGLVVGAVVLVIGALGPVIFTDFYLSQIITKALFLGIAASSLIFLAAYGGRVSLGQTALYGVAGFTMANLVLAEGGSSVALGPWAGAILGVVAATVIGLFMGAISSRSAGIYFLMITLAFAVLTEGFFGKVNQLGGFGGVNNVDRPGLVGTPEQGGNPLYYTCLVASVGVYLLLRYLVRTPFGITLQGIRDEPTRMRALGYNVELHRTLAFGVGAFVAGISGILFTWWNGNISPGAINLGATLDLLVIAVVGGLLRIEGAWIGALVFVVLDNATRQVDFIGARFNTVIGAIFFVIVLLSPGGLMGIWESVTGYARRRSGGGSSGRPEPTAESAGG